MTSILTPGLYFQPVQPVRAVGLLARGDIPVFLGYARRGPSFADGSGTPVRVESLRQFLELFGDPVAGGHLAQSVKAFFEMGGSVCYVLRVVDESAAAASALLLSAEDDPDAPPLMRWRAQASFPWPRIDPRSLSGSDHPGAQAWAAAFEAQVRENGRRTDDVGVWGNRLSVTVSRRALVSTETETGLLEEGYASRVPSLAGLEARSILELHQDRVLSVGEAPVHLQAQVEVEESDPVRQLIRWKVSPQSLPAGHPSGAFFDLQQPIRIVSVEFRVDVFVDGRLAERFDYLSPHPQHSRSLVTVLGEECRNLQLLPAWTVDADTDWTDPQHWPVHTSVALSGGADGVAGVGAAHYIAALGASARVDEIALVAAPDLVKEAAALPSVSGTTSTVALDCTHLSPPGEGLITGRVRAGGVNAKHPPALRGAVVEAAELSGTAITDSAGAFRIDGVPLELGLATLRLSREGFAPSEAIAQVFEFAPEELPEFSLDVLTEPRRLDDDEILTVQQAMMNPAVVGPYRVAVLDPPASTMKLDDLRTWRTRLGDSRRGAFFVPWLKVPGLDTITSGQAQPPSGHVCGALAAGEHASGVHRAPANLLLRHVDGVSLTIDDAEQGLLNPAGINAIRAFPGRGIRIWGTRTLSSDPEWRYLTTRRLLDAIEKGLERGLQWAVFEPNNLVTRQAVSFTIGAMLERLWRAGALAGAKQAEAFAVKSDFDNNPQVERDAGRLIAEVAVAPSIPFEFVFFRLGRTLDTIEVTE